MAWRQAIICTNADPIHRRIYAAPWGESEMSINGTKPHGAIMERKESFWPKVS